MLSFRPLVPSDFPLLLDWLQRPHVKEWWDDGEDTIEKVAANYGVPADSEERFVLMLSPLDGGQAQPIGYFQWYLHPDGSAGIDLFIGEEQLLNQGIGTQAIRLFLGMLIERHDPPVITVDPEPRNRRAIRAYEKAGFRYYETISGWHGLPAYMMRIERETSRQRPAAE